MLKLPEIFAFERQITVKFEVMAFSLAEAEATADRILSEGEMTMKAVSQDTLEAAGMAINEAGEMLLNAPKPEGNVIPFPKATADEEIDANVEGMTVN